MYVAVVAIGAALFIFADNILAEQNGHEDMDPRVMGVLLAVVGGPLAIFFGIAPFLNRRVGWIVGIVAIAIGMTSACCLPATIPLMIFWVNRNTRTYFGIK
jgi:hypothetical protein